MSAFNGVLDEDQIAKLSDGYEFPTNGYESSGVPTLTCPPAGGPCDTTSFSPKEMVRMRVALSEYGVGRFRRSMALVVTVLMAAALAPASRHMPTTRGGPCPAVGEASQVHRVKVTSRRLIRSRAVRPPKASWPKAGSAEVGPRRVRRPPVRAGTLPSSGRPGRDATRACRGPCQSRPRSRFECSTTSPLVARSGRSDVLARAYRDQPEGRPRRRPGRLLRLRQRLRRFVRSRLRLSSCPPAS